MHPRSTRQGLLSILRSLARALALVAALASATGCVSYRSGKLAQGGGLDSRSANASKSISVLVRLKLTVNGEDRELPSYLREAWIRATIEAYEQMGLFTEVKRGRRPDVDLQAAITIENEVVGSPAFAFLSAFTWLLLPSRSRDLLNVRTTYRLPGGEIVGQYNSKEQVTTWFQAFLLPFTLFARRDSVVERTIADLSRATAKAARAKGLL